MSLLHSCTCSRLQFSTSQNHSPCTVKSRGHVTCSSSLLRPSFLFLFFLFFVFIVQQHVREAKGQKRCIEHTEKIGSNNPSFQISLSLTEFLWDSRLQQLKNHMQSQKRTRWSYGKTLGRKHTRRVSQKEKTRSCDALHLFHH